MKIKISYLILFLIFALTLGIRLYLVFSVPNFSDDAYLQLRHINSLVQDKKLIFYDELSYGGRYVLQPPLFNILMALFTFGNNFLLKLIPEFLFSLLVIIVYFTAKEISGDEYSSLFAALLSGFVPIFLKNTMNLISPYSLALPLLLFMFYSVLKLEQKFYRNTFIVISFLLPFIHPIGILFIITMIFYFLILSGGAVTATKIKNEAVLFACLAIIFIEIIIYRKALFAYGLSTIWQNIPINILEDSYRQFTATELLLGVGLLPLVLGSIGVYLGMNQKNKAGYIFAGFILSILALLVLRLITMADGLMILGIALSIFSASAITKIKTYFNKTKLGGLNYGIALILLVSFVLFSFVPSYVKPEYVNSDDINDMLWLKENTKPGDTVIGNLHQGHLINSVAGRKNVVDTNFLLAPNPVKRLKDIDLIYNTFTEAKILEVIRTYNVKVIYLSDNTKKL